MTAYSDPQSTHNPTTGAVIPASWGDAVRDAIEFVARNKSHCRVYNSASLSLANNTATAITFNSERYDVGAMHDTSSNTSRVTVPSGEAAKFNAAGCIQFATSGAGNRSAYIRLNGTTILGRMDDPNHGGFSVVVALTVTLPGAYSLAAGDYLELVGLQNSGGALNAEAAGNYSPELGVWWEAM